MATSDLDVTPESSTGATELAPDDEVSGGSPVTLDQSPDGSGDRPLHNFKAEFDRKLGRVDERFSTLEQLMAQVLNVVTTSGTSAPATPNTTEKEYTDEELLELWQNGSKAAGDMLVDRKMDRRERERDKAAGATNMIRAQLQNLFTRYPTLRDANHPLTKAAIATRNALLQSGLESGPILELEAIKVAIADNPDLAASALQRNTSVGDSRSSSADVSSFGVAPRRTASTPRGKPALSEASKKLAKRMGVKDPSGAMERMRKRWENRSSSISPLLISSLGVEE